MNPDSVVASIDASWLLFDGGMRRGYDQQARGMVDMMKAEAHRTDLQVVDAVKRYYYGAILAGQVQRLVEMRVDCDADTLLLRVDQTGVACHTGRRSCFYRAIGPDAVVEIPVERIDPASLYG